jgi:cytochrome c peroxidase
MDDAGEPFTNYEYHNIGTPTNTALRRRNAVEPAHRDPGLAANPQVSEANLQGRFKVPTLRNVAITGPYMHNGVFAELRTVIEFYDQYNNPERGLNPETGQAWEQAEIAETVELDELKAKKLDERRIDALIAFLRTLTDERYESLLE